METQDLLKFINSFERVEISHIIIKHLIENGIDSYVKLKELLNQDNHLSNVTKNHLENAMGDFEHGFLKLNKIPSVQKKT